MWWVVRHPFPLWVWGGRSSHHIGSLALARDDILHAPGSLATLDYAFTDRGVHSLRPPASRGDMPHRLQGVSSHNSNVSEREAGWGGSKIQGVISAPQSPQYVEIAGVRAGAAATSLVA